MLKRDKCVGNYIERKDVFFILEGMQYIFYEEELEKVLKGLERNTATFIESVLNEFLSKMVLEKITED